MDKYEALRNIHPLTVLTALGVETSTFKKRSNKPEWAGKCPIHESKNNTGCFSIHQDGRYSCFSCSAKGKGMVDLCKAVRRWTFTQAVEFLTPLLSKVAPTEKNAPERVPESTGAIELKPFTGSYEKFKVPCPWLETRIPDAAIRERYGVFAYNNPARKSAYSGRVMLPVKDVEGVVYGFLGRDTTDSTNTTASVQQAKYLFPKDLPKSRFLFGAHELRQHLLSLGTGRSVYQHVYLLESPFAVMKFASMGLPAVSPFGWSVSEQQLDILSSLARGLVYLPDSNKREQGFHIVGQLTQRVWVRFPQLPAGIDDPEEMTKEQILAL